MSATEISTESKYVIETISYQDDKRIKKIIRNKSFDILSETTYYENGGIASETNYVTTNWFLKLLPCYRYHRSSYHQVTRYYETPKNCLQAVEHYYCDKLKDKDFVEYYESGRRRCVQHYSLYWTEYGPTQEKGDKIYYYDNAQNSISKITNRSNTITYLENGQIDKIEGAPSCYAD